MVRGHVVQIVPADQGVEPGVHFETVGVGLIDQVLQGVETFLQHRILDPRLGGYVVIRIPAAAHLDDEGVHVGLQGVGDELVNLGRSLGAVMESVDPERPDLRARAVSSAKTIGIKPMARVATRTRIPISLLIRILPPL